MARSQVTARWAPAFFAVALVVAALGSIACGGGDDGKSTPGAGGSGSASTTGAGGPTGSGGPGVEGSIKSTGALEGTWTWKSPGIVGCSSSKPYGLEIVLNDGTGKFMNLKLLEDGTWKAQSGVLRSSIEGTGARVSSTQSGTKVSMQAEVNGTGKGDAGSMTLDGSLKVQCN